jgi:hypothetical protein
VVGALVLVAFSSNLRFESPWVQTISLRLARRYLIRVERALCMVQGLPNRGGYMKLPYLGGVPCHKKKDSHFVNGNDRNCS